MIVVGAGVAGLTAVHQLATAGAPVTLVTAGRFGLDATALGNTALAQGGIAAALGHGDSSASHALDTITAGAGLVNAAVARLLAEDGIRRVNHLLAAGFPADRDHSGQLILGMEGAHGHARIVHAGEDRSGAQLSSFLTDQVQRHISTGAVQLIEEATLTHLDAAAGRITGVRYTTAGIPRQLAADAVILATGGYAGLYATTSSSSAVNGRGIAAAATAGAVLADMEFVQFHPTVLPTTGELISEAVRGAGAVLRDANGHRFMLNVHPDAELAPRDVVSRTSVSSAAEHGLETVWLDATVIDAAQGTGTLARRFPVLTQRLAAHGIDWATDWVPVAPAAHYCMGGVATDTWARSSVPGLFAAGEAASTGVHGANRLASNSLLEGLVFGARAAQAAQHYVRDETWELDEHFQRFLATAQPVQVGASAPVPGDRPDAMLPSLTQRYAGITRTATGLVQLLAALESIPHPLTPLVQVIASAALARTESRGGHWRADYPDTDPAQATRSAWRLVSAPQPGRHGHHTTETKEYSSHVDA